ELGEVVEQPAEARAVAAAGGVESAAAAVEEEHLEPRGGERLAGARVPPAVAADAVDEHEPGPRRPGRGVPAVVERVAVGGAEDMHRARASGGREPPEWAGGLG